MVGVNGKLGLIKLIILEPFPKALTGVSLDVN